MKTKVKKTGEIIEVTDYGEKWHPRYWNDKQGYSKEELEFEKPRKPRITKTKVLVIMEGGHVRDVQKPNDVEVEVRIFNPKDLQELPRRFFRTAQKD